MTRRVEADSPSAAVCSPIASLGESAGCASAIADVASVERPEPLAQRALGIPAVRAGGGDQREQRVAEFGLGARLGRRPLDARDPDLRALPRSFCASASDGIRSLTPSSTLVRALLLGGLRGVPVHEHLLGRVRDGVAEDMRMPPHHLLGEPACDVVDVERLVGVARGDLGVEQHLPEQIAELLAQFGAGSRPRRRRSARRSPRRGTARARGGRSAASRRSGRGRRASSPRPRAADRRHRAVRASGSVMTPPAPARRDGARRAATRGSPRRSSEITEPASTPRIAWSRISGCDGEGELGQQQRHREPDAAERARGDEVGEGERAAARRRLPIAQRDPAEDA